MHMRFALGTALTCLGVVGAHAAELPFLKAQSEYSATRIIETSEGNFEQKVNWTEDKVRTETMIEGVTLLNIVREDLGVMWISNAELGRCIEQPVESVEEVTQLGGQYASEDVEYKEVGKESLGGRPTTKYEVMADDEEIGPHKAYFWVTEESILVRMEMAPMAEDTQIEFTMRLEDLELGPQESALFESPGDCVSLPNMGRP